MIQVVIFAVLTGGSIIALFTALIVMRLRASADDRESDFGEAGSFSIARYQPMTRLLAEEDFAFLAAQPGYRPEIGAKLRRERRRIFRLYLRELARDFRRLHAEAREMVASSQEENAGVVGLLMKQQVKFWGAMTAVRIRLALDRVGAGNVDTRSLIDAVEAMRIDLARFAPPAAAAR